MTGFLIALAFGMTWGALGDHVLGCVGMAGEAAFRLGKRVA